MAAQAGRVCEEVIDSGSNSTTFVVDLDDHSGTCSEYPWLSKFISQQNQVILKIGYRAAKSFISNSWQVCLERVSISK